MATTTLEGKSLLVTLPLTDQQREDFTTIVEGAGGTVRFVREHHVLDTDVAGVSIIIGNVPAKTLHAPEQLMWLQTSSAGYDHYLTEDRLAETTLLTNATGAYGQAVSEHMLASLLALMKRICTYRDNQRDHVWRDEGPVRSLVGATVLVLGTGDIGTSFARLVTALGAEAWGVRRKVESCSAPFTRMVSLADIDTLLSKADVVACVLPSSDETRGLASDGFFATMREGSFFVNAGRGDLVDTAALVRALRSGHLAGAALDVTDPEPLPPDHELWAEPHALITPHVAGFWHLQATTDNVCRICRDNLLRYLKGEPLRNVVER